MAHLKTTSSEGGGGICDLDSIYRVAQKKVRTSRSIILFSLFLNHPVVGKIV